MDLDFETIIKEELKELKYFEVLTEVTARRKRVVRGGKVIKKRKCPPGYKLVGGRRCVRQAAKERIRRKRAGRKAARKSKSARRRQFKRSIRVRQRRRLKRTKR